MVDENTPAGAFVCMKGVDKTHIIEYQKSGTRPDEFCGKVVESEVHLVGSISEHWARSAFERHCDFQEDKFYTATKDLKMDGHPALASAKVAFFAGKSYKCLEATSSEVIFSSEISKAHPMPLSCRFVFFLVPSEKVVDNSFPHSCPKCGGPAYIGFSAVDCKNKCLGSAGN